MIFVDGLVIRSGVGPLIAQTIASVLIERVVVRTLFVGHDRTLVHPVVPRAIQHSTELGADLQTVDRHQLCVDSRLRTQEAAAVVFLIINGLYRSVRTAAFGSL